MPKSDVQKAIEKQIQEQKRIAESQKRQADKLAREERERNQKARIDAQAQSIVSNANTVNGFKIMDGESEEFLQIAQHKINEALQEGKPAQSQIGIRIEELPDHLQRSFSLQIKKLEHYGMISGAIDFFRFVQFTLTPEGLNYFEDKEKAMSAQPPIPQQQHKKYDVFISHANKDKEDYVEKLYDTVKKLGINVFYDKEIITWGDNWKRVILEGTADSEFAVIVISQNFFGREWTERELNEFLTQQNESGQKRVLPLLYGITRQELIAHYPELEEIQYISTGDYNEKEITIMLARELIKRYK